jgi:hypothetical protein
MEPELTPDNQPTPPTIRHCDSGSGGTIRSRITGWDITLADRKGLVPGWSDSALVRTMAADNTDQSVDTKIFLAPAILTEMAHRVRSGEIERPSDYRRAYSNILKAYEGYYAAREGFSFTLPGSVASEPPPAALEARRPVNATLAPGARLWLHFASIETIKERLASLLESIGGDIESGLIKDPGKYSFVTDEVGCARKGPTVRKASNMAW